jgi:hypothetical protein
VPWLIGSAAPVSQPAALPYRAS